MTKNRVFAAAAAMVAMLCVSCGTRWISVRPAGTPLKSLECKNCGPGNVIETGEEINE